MCGLDIRPSRNLNTLQKRPLASILPKSYYASFGSPAKGKPMVARREYPRLIDGAQSVELWVPFLLRRRKFWGFRPL
jgi:hypothetical protein